MYFNPKYMFEGNLVRIWLVVRIQKLKFNIKWNGVILCYLYKTCAGLILREWVATK